jgi:hypothetical protein
MTRKSTSSATPHNEVTRAWRDAPTTKPPNAVFATLTPRVAEAPLEVRACSFNNRQRFRESVAQAARADGDVR